MRKKNLQNKNCLIVLTILLSLLLNACASSPPDIDACIELSVDKGYCTKTIADKSFYVDEDNLLDNKTWFELRPYMIQLPVTSWVKLKAYIIKMCKKTGQCDSEISSWDRKLIKIDNLIDRKIEE